MNLDFENIDQLFENSLEGMELTPSSSVKALLKKKMFWYNAFKSIYVQLSLSAFVLTSVVGVVLWVTNTAEPSVVNLDPVNAKEITLELNEFDQLSNKNNGAESDNVSFNLNSISENATEKLVDDTKEEVNIDENSGISNNIPEIIQENVTTSTPIENEKLFVQKQLTVKNEILALKNSSTEPLEVERNKLERVDEQQTLVQRKEPVQNKIEDQPLVNPNRGIVPTKSKQVQNTKELESVNETETVASTPEFLYDSEVLQSVNTERTFIEILPAKSLFFKDIPYPMLSEYKVLDDTVGIDIHGQSIILPSNRWTLGAYARPNYSFSRIINSNSEGTDLSGINKGTFEPAMSYGFGLDLLYQFKQFSVGGGLAYSQYAQEFNTLDKSLQTEVIDNWTLFNVDHWQVDSVAYINLDSLLQGDTVLTYISDSINNPTQDSTHSTVTDSTWANRALTYKNVYQYIEIPLFVEYTFNRSKTWQPFVRGGLVTGIYIKTQGYLVSSEGQITSLEALPFAKVIFWAHAGIGMKYNLNKRFSAYTMLNYRYNLNAIINDEQYINQHLDNTGLTFGFQYHF